MRNSYIVGLFISKFFFAIFNQVYEIVKYIYYFNRLLLRQVKNQ